MRKRNSLYQEKATLSLINKQFWKSKIGPICALSLPFFLMTIYRIIGKENITYFETGIAAYFSFSILPLCFISLPQMIVEFKTSIVMRKISQSNISPLKLCILILAYNLVAIILSTLIIILLYAIFLNVNAPAVFGRWNWAQLVYALFNVWISCLTFGLLIGVLVNRINLVQAIAFGIIIVSISLSGQFIPIHVLARSEALRYITLASPSSYGLNLLNVVLTNNNSAEIKGLYELSKHYPLIEFDAKSLDVYRKEIESYEFSGIFDLIHPYKLFSFKLTALDPEIPSSFIKLPTFPPEFNGKNIYISGIKSVTAYYQWQSGLNIVMPYVTTITFLAIAIKKFKWISR